MKYLYFQDLHIKGKNSINRLGNYFEDLLLKIDEIIQIAKENECQAILDGGDLYEVEKPSFSILDAVADKFEKGKIPVYSLLGNHAMRYGHIANSKNTGLIHLQNRSKYFEYLNNVEEKDHIIKAIDYDFGIEDKIKEEGIMFDDTDKWKIAIIHALVTPGDFFKDVSYIKYSDIKTNVDLLLVAHYHKPYAFTLKNTKIINIGCSGRDNIDESDVEPSVLLIDTLERKYEQIKLKSAKPANEIFDLTKYAEKKQDKKDIKEFLESLKNLDLQSMDTCQQIVKIGKEQKVEQNIVDHILEIAEGVKDE